MLFFYFSTDDDNRIVKATLSDGRLGTPTVILDGIPHGFIHDGGRLAFGPDGYLYASTGETGQRRARPGQEHHRRQDPADHHRRRPGAGQPVQGLADLVLRAPQRAGARVRRPGPAVGLGVRAEHVRRAQPDQPGQELRLADGRGPRRRRQGLVDPQVVWDTDDASPSGLAWLDGHLWLASLKGERLWRVDVDGKRASDPADFFVGKYGRMRTVVVAPDGRPLGDDQQHRRPRRPAGRRRPDPGHRALTTPVTVARRAARRSVARIAGPSSTIATAVVIARIVSQLPVDVSSV